MKALSVIVLALVFPSLSVGCRARPPHAEAPGASQAPPPSALEPAPAATAPITGGEGAKEDGGDGQPAEAAVRSITIPDLVKLLKSRKDLRALSLQTAGIKFGGLVPVFEEKNKDDDVWEFEGSNDSGLVRSITITFVPAGEDAWAFRSVTFRLHSEDPRRTFQEIRRAANASLKRPKWLDLNAHDRTAWSLGEGWELVAAVLDDGDIHLRAGRPAL